MSGKFTNTVDNAFMTSPSTAYVVCATPRSGSTLLCELLTATGVAGRPAEPFERLRATDLPRQPRQYFDGVADPAVLDLLEPTQPGRELSAAEFEERLAEVIAAGTTPNGVFATKLMWGFALELFVRLREREPSRGLAPAEALAATFPVAGYVHVTRADKVAQAVSLWTAVQTAHWRDEGDGAPAHEPEYSFVGIAHLLGQLQAQDHAWRSWFVAAGITPVTVDYDGLVGDQEGTVRRVLDAIGIDAAEATIDPPAMRRQSGERSAEWKRRFEDERRAAV